MAVLGGAKAVKAVVEVDVNVSPASHQSIITENACFTFSVTKTEELDQR